MQEDIGLTLTLPDLNIGVSVFNNYIQNYISLAQLVDANGESVILIPGNKTYQYQQSSAQLYGFETQFSLHPTGFKRKWLSDITIKADVDHNAKQDRYLALNSTETFTPAYTLVNAGIDGLLHFNQNSPGMRLIFQVNNLFDVAYQSNLSRLKYFEYFTQSPNGHLGMYGMGRNICVKVILPFN